MPKFTLLLSLYIFIAISSVNAIKNLTYSNNFTIIDGIAHNGVTSLLEDSKGYVWIGTYDGINKYDGYGFRTYKNTYEEDIIISNRVRSLCEDKKGNIWIGTDNGISIYDYKIDRFYNLYPKSATPQGLIVRKIIESNNKKLIICCTEGNGILIFDNNYNFKNQIITDSKVVFYEGIELDSTKFLFSTSQGLKLLDVQEQTILPIFQSENQPYGAIKRIEDNVFVYSLQFGVGVVKYSIVDGEYRFNIDSKHFQQGQFSSIELDDNNNLWLGTTYKGVIKVVDVEQLVNDKPYETEEFRNEAGLLRTSRIMFSPNTGCWVGTFNKGIYRFGTKDNPFKTYNTNMHLEHGVSTNSILYIDALDNERVLVSASRGGMALYNTSEHNFEPLPFDLPETYSKEVGAVFVDSRNDIWFSTALDLGLCRVRNGSRKVIPIDTNKYPLLKDKHPRTFTEDKNGSIWMGDETGVYKININRQGSIISVEALNNHPFFNKTPLELVRCVYADPQYDYIWIGTDSDGLIRIENEYGLDLNQVKISQSLRDKYNSKSISSNFVSCILRLPNGEFWIGTEGGGLCKVMNTNSIPEFLVFTEKHGLSNDVVKSIAYDSQHNLWVATNIGLSKFNTKEYKFRSFKIEDGLPYEDFWYLNDRLNNGYIVFSGLQGMCYFKPSELEGILPIPKIEFEDLKVFNKSIRPNVKLNNRVILNTRLSDVSQIELKYNENSFSFNVNSLHFSTPETHTLKYQLLPVNEDWIEVPSSQRNISFNELNPGDYKFRVMASNSRNEWSEPKELAIVISSPFWKTIPAIILYVLLVILILYVVITVVLRINRLQYNLEIEHLEHDKIKEVNAAKLRFFSNISHEIKTPLTLISGPINILTKRFERQADVNAQLQIVRRQSRKISQLIDQVHDFQRSDANFLELQYSQFSINSLIKNLALDFEFMAKNDRKEFLVKSNDEDIFVSADRDKLEKILNNLLNNAFKYTKQGDAVVVEFRREKKNLEIKIIDTGRGIEQSDQSHVFERFYQSKNKHSEYTGGSGIGLAFSMRLAQMHYGDIQVQSVLNEGSTFTVTLPIVIDSSSEEQNQVKENVLSIEKEFSSNAIVEEDIDVSRLKIDKSLSDSTIFFVEDNTEMRQFISGVLSGFCEVKTFVNGKECLDEMESEWPDMVVSDVLMPEMNGFDLCKQLKSDLKTSHIPVVLLTACTSIEDQIKGMEFGADAYIKKPFNVQYLVSTCEALLRSRKRLRERFKIDLPLDLSSVDKEEVANNKVFLEKFYALIEKNLDNPDIELSNFAKELYLNRTHFFQKVKAITNQTPYELIKSYRIKKAAEILVEKRLPVNDVFLMTGFKSRAHFNKLFKAKYEVSPGKYANEVLKKMK